MASGIFSLLFSSCMGRRSNDAQEERAPLLNPDILPEAPAQHTGRTTEHQQAEQEALRRILNEASERFVNIESPSPFSRPSPYSSRSPSPDPSSSPGQKEPQSIESQLINSTGSSWRPSSGSVKVVHLGTNFDPHEDSIRHKHIKARPSSAHSLKTLPKNVSEPTPSPLGNRSRVSRGESSRYGTETSYRTATENGMSDTEQEELGSNRQQRAVPAVNDIKWDEDEDVRRSLDPEDQAAESERQVQLTKAIKAMEESMNDFRLVSTGPLVEDLDSIA